MHDLTKRKKKTFYHSFSKTLKYDHFRFSAFAVAKKAFLNRVGESRN